MPYFGIPIRNGLPIGLGSSAGFGIAPFEPYSLFENGEQGAWYDPSDFSTLFTDSAGTTPVTGVEQFVGLMLDKSKGLVLGSELVTNGDFSSGTTGWTGADAVLSVVSGQLGVTPNDNFTRTAYQSFSVTAGRTYVLQFNYNQNTATTLRYFAGTSLGSGSDIPLTVLSGSGFVTRYFTATGSTLFIQFGAPNSAGLTALFDNISVRELPGNHATQTTSAKRPKLAARYNLLTYSEEFDNADWLKFGVTISPNAGTAPDGTTTADLIYPSSTGTDRTLYRGGFASISKTHSVAAKAAGKNWFCIYQEDTTGGAAWFDLANGTVGTVAAGFANATITPLGNGWYRCSVTSTSSFNQYTAFAPVDADNSNTLTVNSTDGALIWGADLRPASQATGLIGPTYQRVAAATVYDTAGFLPYLAFDGLSWSMTTNSIDFSAGDKVTAWAGVRKLSDAATGMLAAQTAWNTAGGFGLYAPSYVATPGGKYFVGLRGSNLGQVDYATYNAPITNVLALSMDIGGAALTDEIKMRINAANVAFSASSGTAGTGNFPNSVLEIGAFGSGSSTFLNGWLTSLIVRGAQSTQSQIEATEAWVNGKTGAY